MRRPRRKARPLVIPMSLDMNRRRRLALLRSESVLPLLTKLRPRPLLLTRPKAEGVITRKAVRVNLRAPRRGLALQVKREPVKHVRCVEAKKVRRKMFFRAGRSGGRVRDQERRYHKC